MSKRKLVSCWIAIFVAIGLFISIGYHYWTRGVYISITNNTQDVFKVINISYTGGIIRIAKLEPKTSYGQRINPIGESGLKLGWLDSSGVKQSQKIEVYFEHNYTGSVGIMIEAGNRVSVTNRIRLGPWPL